MHWCLGMYGSASTWTYNVALKLAAALDPSTHVVGRFIYDLDDFDGIDGSRTVFVAKSHAPAAEAEGELARRADAIIITIRDPRDAIASLVRHNGVSFDLALFVTAASARVCDRYAGDSRANLLRYEDKFTGDRTTVDRIAETFGNSVTASDRDRVFDETRRPSIEAFIARLETLPTFETDETGDAFDTVTQWHRHHAGRTGEVGRWRRELQPIQVALIEYRLGDWMAKWGYRAVTPGPHSFQSNIVPYAVTLPRLGPSNFA